MKRAKPLSLQAQLTLVELLERRFPAREINAGLLRKLVVDGYIILMPGPGPYGRFGLRSTRVDYAVLTAKGIDLAERFDSGHAFLRSGS